MVTPETVKIKTKRCGMHFTSRHAITALQEAHENRPVILRNMWVFIMGQSGPTKLSLFHWIICQLMICVRKQLTSPSLRGEDFVFTTPTVALFNWHRVFAFFFFSNHSITDSVDMNVSKWWKIVEDREACCAAVHGVAKSQTWLSDWRATTNNQSNDMKGTSGLVHTTVRKISHNCSGFGPYSTELTILLGTQHPLSRAWNLVPLACFSKK